jgi:hypothetical protein
MQFTTSMSIEYPSIDEHEGHLIDRYSRDMISLNKKMATIQNKPYHIKSNTVSYQINQGKFLAVLYNTSSNL